MVDKEVKEIKATYELSEIPTQTALVIKNNSTGEIYNDTQGIVLILNKLEKLEKGLL